MRALLGHARPHKPLHPVPRALHLSLLPPSSASTRLFVRLLSTDTTTGGTSDLDPPPRFPRQPFNPRFRLPSHGPFTSLLSPLLRARQELDALAINPFAHSATTIRTAEREYAFQDAAVTSSLGLHCAEEGDQASQPGWREDVRQAVERELPLLCGASAAEQAQARTTLRLLLAGRFLPYSSGVPSGRSLLHGLRTPDSLSTVDPAFGELLRLVQAVLEVRKVELEVGDEPKLLDGTARSLLFAIEDYFGGVERVHASRSQEKGRVEKRLCVFVGGEQQVVEATPEQAAVIRSPRVEPGLTRVTSGAGTGKTTTLRGIVQRLSSTTSPRLVTRSKRLQEELKVYFGGGAGVDERCQTLSAFVKRTLEERYGERFLRKWEEPRRRRGEEKRLRPLEHKEVANLLEIKPEGVGIWDVFEERWVRLVGKRIAERVLLGFYAFLVSADPSPSIKHVLFSRHRFPPLKPNVLLPLVEHLWARVSDMEDVEAPLPFSAQVKLAQLDPTFRFSGTGPLLVDEVQDLNECELDLVVRERDRRRVVLVGDPLQALDGWRGATDAWTRVQADLDFTLSESRRFGHNVAAVANAHLAVYGQESASLIGSPEKQTRVYRRSRVSERKGRTVIYQGYYRLYLEGVATLLASPTPPRSFRILSSEIFEPLAICRLARHAYRLFRNDPPFLGYAGTGYDPYEDYQSYHAALGGFSTWDAFLKEVKSWGCDLPRRPHPVFQPWHFALELEKRGMLERPDSLEVLNEVERRLMVDEKQPADVTLTIAYQAKGLEFKHVVLPPGLLGSRLAQRHRRHVALTRATDSLELSNGLLAVPVAKMGLHGFRIDWTTSSPCSSCGTSLTSQLNYHTPFPFHPSHLAQVQSADGNLDAQLDSAKEHYAALKPEHFPLCLDCAAEQTSYGPLKDVVAFARPAGSEIDDAAVVEEDTSWGVVPGSEADEATDEAATTRFDGFVEKAAARRTALLEAAKEEIEVKSF